MFRLLLIDGSGGVARALAPIVERGEIELVAIASTNDAIQAVQRQRFDISLIHAPGEAPDWTCVLSLLRAADIDLPIVALASSTAEEDLLPAIEAGAQEALPFPGASARDVMNALRRAMARVKATEQRLQLGADGGRKTEEAEARSRFLALASQILVSSLDPETTLQAVAHLATEHLATLCLIEGAGAGDPSFVAVTGDASNSHLVTTMRTRGYARAAPGHPRSAARRGEATLIQAGASAVLLSGVDEAEERFLRAIAPESCVVVPLFARGAVRGTMTLIRTGTEAPFAEEDLELAEDLAGRIALAVDNSRLYREARAAALARDEVMAIVSHDLRNPLAVVSMTTYNLRRTLRESTTYVAAQLDKLERSTDRMSRLIEDLLDVTRLDAGALALERQPHAVAELLKDVHDLHAPLAEQRRVQLEYTPAEAGLLVDADRHRALQVLSNLLGNAIKFTPEAGRVCVNARVEELHVVFSVRDTGPGIEEQHVSRLFDRYWQANQGDRRGTGLGLAIARGLVEAHGGRIWVDSEVNVGSTFFFTLPKVTARPEAPSPPPSDGSSAAPSPVDDPGQSACG